MKNSLVSVESAPNLLKFSSFGLYSVAPHHRHTPPPLHQSRPAQVPRRCPLLNSSESRHFARNCPQRQRHNNNYANLIDFNDDDQEYYDNYAVQQPANPLDDIKARLAHLSGDDKAKLAEEMGVDEDLPTA